MTQLSAKLKTGSKKRNGWPPMNGSQDGQDTCRHMLVSHGLIVLSGINLDPAVFAVQTCVPMPAVCREPSNGKRIYKGIMSLTYGSVSKTDI